MGGMEVDISRQPLLNPNHDPNLWLILPYCQMQLTLCFVNYSTF